MRIASRLLKYSIVYESIKQYCRPVIMVALREFPTEVIHYVYIYTQITNALRPLEGPRKSLYKYIMLGIGSSVCKRLHSDYLDKNYLSDHLR